MRLGACEELVAPAKPRQLLARNKCQARSQWGKADLAAVKAMMQERAEDWCASLWSDLRSKRVDADLTDVKVIAGEVDHVLAHLSGWMKPFPVSTPLMLAPSHAQVRCEPLGVG